MRRRLRPFFIVVALLLLALAVLAGVVAMGRQPMVNRWVERRLIAELQTVGIATNAVQVKELSWRRAVVGPVDLQLPGLKLRLEEASAELGWSVWSQRVGPHIILRGIEVTLDLDRIDDLRRLLGAQKGNRPNGNVRIERARVVLQRGGDRWEVPFDGEISSLGDVLQAELSLRSPTLAARLALRANQAANSADLTVRDGRLEPAAWKTLFGKWIPAAVPRLTELAADTLEFSGSLRFAQGAFRQAEVTLAVPRGTWQRERTTAQAREARVAIKLAAGLHPHATAKVAEAVVDTGNLRARGTNLELTLERDFAALQIADAELDTGGTKTRIHGKIESDWTAERGWGTATADLRVESAARGDWRLGKPLDLQLRWNNGRLTGKIPQLLVVGPQAFTITELEAAVNGFNEGRPQLTGHCRVATDVAAWLAPTVPGLEMLPATAEATVTLTANLEPARESLRAELAVLPEQRVVRWSGGAVTAFAGLQGEVTLDREFVAGNLRCGATRIDLLRGKLTAHATAGELRMALPRTWWSVCSAWGKQDLARTARDIFWSGDFDLHVDGASARQPGLGEAAGLNLHARSRGANLSEDNGADVGCTADTITVHGISLNDLQLQIAGGLTSARCEGRAGLGGFPVTVSAAQTVRWDEGWSVEGTYGFADTELLGTEPWEKIWPPLAALTASGRVAVQGHDRLAGGVWSGDADIDLHGFSLHWPARHFSIEGIESSLKLADVWPLRSLPGQRLHYKRAEAAGVEFTEGEIQFAVAAPNTFRVEKMNTNAFGGQLAVGAFGFDPRNPDFKVAVRVSAAQVDQLLRLFRDVPVVASGVVEGEVPLGWHLGRLLIGTGHFGLKSGEFGRVRFTRDLQPLTAGRTPGGSEYELLRKIETAILELHVDRLRIDTYPTAVFGRSLQVRMVGVPVGGELSTPVEFDLNVNAPLEDFVNLGVSGKIALGGAR